MMTTEPAVPERAKRRPRAGSERPAPVTAWLSLEEFELLARRASTNLRDPEMQATWMLREMLRTEPVEATHASTH